MSLTKRRQHCWQKSVAVLLLLAANSAVALSLQPQGPFEAAGRFALGTGLVSAHCEMRLRGEVTPTGGIQINTAQFFGANPACGRLQADKLPWQGQLLASDQLQIDGVTVVIKSLLFGGVCGPASLLAAVDEPAATLRFPKTPLPPDCRLEGAVKFMPALQVLP